MTKLLSNLRILEFDLEDHPTILDEWLEQYAASKTVEIFNSRIERAVIFRLTTLCYEALNTYPRTLKEDRRILAEQDLSENSRNALKVVIEERETLNEIIEQCK